MGMTTQNIWFETSVTRLTDPQNQRVWSLIVSLFGDLAQQPGDRISGGALTRIIQPMGIKPEAMRVALHRLRKDGWIESTRSGRASVHFLTDFGRAQSAKVTPRIYNRAPEIPKDWHILIAEDGPGIHTLDDLLLAENYISIGRTVALGSGPLPKNCDDLVAFEATARSVPDWLKTRLCPPDLILACKDLRDAAKSVTQNRPQDAHPTAWEIAALRTLLIHRWRRVVLRHPGLPRAFFPSGWAGPDCRFEVFRLLDTLSFPTLDALNKLD